MMYMSLLKIVSKDYEISRYYEIENEKGEIIEGKQLEVNYHYNEGGYNYFSGESYKRGYYISVGLCSVSFNEKGEISSKVTQAFSYPTKLLKEVKRRNKKQFEEVYRNNEDIERELRDYVILKGGF